MGAGRRCTNSPINTGVHLAEVGRGKVSMKAELAPRRIHGN